MKRHLIYLLPFIIIAAAGCVKSSSTYTPPPVPSGNFSGQFRIVTLKKTSSGYDTAKATLQVTFKNTNQYAVNGDTTTLHAGSNGIFAVDGFYAAFNDKTFPTNNTKPKKNHLSGIYQYYYDGTAFQLLRSANDTLYEYDLRKTVN